MSQESTRRHPKLPEAPIDSISAPLQTFIQTEVMSGVVLLVAAIAALLVANSSLGPGFESQWTTPIGLRVGNILWEHPLRYWINDGLITLFFFLVGLEIKREVTSGELSQPGAVFLPIIAALGGMFVPAGVYLLLASEPQAASGWGVVMATDIAFVVGCLAVLGHRIPDSLRAFVLALAIIDDIGAILVIAFAYSQDFRVIPFAGALLGLGLVALLQRLGVRAVWIYWVIGFLTWEAMHQSGIHPTIAGVALGLLTPTRAWVDEIRLDRFLRWAQTTRAAQHQPADHKPKSVRQMVSYAARESISPLERLEDALHPWCAFLVLPVFALANAGVTLSKHSAFDPIAVAVVAGLLFGKPLGILGCSWLGVTLGLARKPDDLTWPLVLAAGTLAGIGFTMALFIGNLAFDAAALQSAKFGILAASLTSGLAGMAMLAACTATRT